MEKSINTFISLWCKPSWMGEGIFKKVPLLVALSTKRNKTFLFTRRKVRVYSLLLEIKKCFVCLEKAEESVQQMKSILFKGHKQVYLEALAKCDWLGAAHCVYFSWQTEQCKQCFVGHSPSIADTTVNKHPLVKSHINWIVPSKNYRLTNRFYNGSWKAILYNDASIAS